MLLLLDHAFLECLSCVAVSHASVSYDHKAANVSVMAGLPSGEKRLRNKCGHQDSDCTTSV